MMNLILWAIAFIGHLGSWCVVYNRTHATNWPRKVRKRCEKLIIAAVLLPLFWFAGRVIGQQTISLWDIASNNKLEWIYLFLMLGLGVFFAARWSWRKFQSPPEAIISNRRTLVNVQHELGRNIYQTSLGMILKKIPFNQAHLIAIESMELGVNDLPSELDGLKICQLSDFHLTGQLELAYFERVVEEANRFKPDLIFITGDLLDELDCLDWIDPVFGQLESRYGTFLIRGNHDLRIADQKLLLQRLESAGMKWIGGQRVSIEIDGTKVVLTGNELPWHTGAETLAPDSLSDRGLQILLTHTPDQIEWARPFNFDLIFAGHNHGGQIAFPIVGPIVAPSKYGVLYASGTFEIDQSIMHVSRGLSGDECIRINCPPEVGCFTLRKV
jgi:predicted MPP superfamily phosphohydrolase